MNEEALQVLYGLAKGDGYTKSYEDFKVLMGGNSDAVQQMYTLARADGYTKNKSDFDVLVGYAPTSAGPEAVEDSLKKKKIRYPYRKMVHWNQPRKLNLLTNNLNF